MAPATALSPGRPTPGVVKQDKSSGGSVDTTNTHSDPQRVRMSSGERPIGAAKGTQSDTEALCQPPPPQGGLVPNVPSNPPPAWRCALTVPLRRRARARRRRRPLSPRADPGAGGQGRGRSCGRHAPPYAHDGGAAALGRVPAVRPPARRGVCEAVQLRQTAAGHGGAAPAEGPGHPGPPFSLPPRPHPCGQADVCVCVCVCVGRAG